MALRLLAPCILVGLVPSVVAAQPPPEDAEPQALEAAEPGASESGPRPFGSNLFTGRFAAQREDGQNPEYSILPGDRVMVNAWGALTVNDVFVVDTQGNIFLPNIGPVHLAGVRNADLTQTVRRAIASVYRRNFGVYTNLLTASPVAVFVTGGVRRPGRYAGIPSDSVLFYLDQAGGIDPHAGSYRDVEIVRQGSSIAELDLYDFLMRGTLPTPQFEDGDTILVGRRGPTVEIRGAAAHATLVELDAEAFTGRDVLAVVPTDARVNEVTVRGARGGRPILSSFSLADFGGAALRDGDVVELRQEGRADRILVRIEGEFEGPSVLSVRRGTRLVDLLNHVPVESALAHTSAVHLRRQQVARQQRQSIDDSLDRLERSALLALSDSRGESEIRAQEAQLVQQFVERARRIQPLGRVVTTSAGHQLNVLLQDEDVVVIPPRTNVVRVGGEVHVAQALMYRPDLTAADYIRMAGGYSNRASTDDVIVLRPNAEVVVGDTDVVVQPGDEILVPPEIDDKIFQNAIDLSQIIYQIAVAASVLIRL
jgi:protein involved in polysaccharide export with SLBB domain